MAKETPGSPRAQAPTREQQERAQKSAPDTDELAKEVQEKFDRETEAGLRGVEVDQTPNENYTVQGVISDKPTPESERGKDKSNA